MSESEQIITDLLRIAKVAMTGRLFAEDPRVARAQAWLEDVAKASDDIREIEATIDAKRPASVPGRVPTAGRRR